MRGDEARHLTRVLRVQPGQLFEISDNGRAYLAEIVEARGERVSFRVLEPVACPPMPVEITLCAALVKFDRFEWMVEMATECGVARIVPVEAARSEKGLREASSKRRERWMRIAREAAQQSRRVSVPAIAEAVRFEESLGAPAAWDPVAEVSQSVCRDAKSMGCGRQVDAGVTSATGCWRYFLDEAAAPPLARALPETRQAGDRIAACIGPEGGWTDEERRAAVAAGWSAVSLGPTILRTETAAVAALSVLLNAWL